MQNLALQEAQRHIMFHHGDSDGWITMARKDAKTGRFSQYHYQPEELAENLSEWMGENVYFSQGTFYRPARRIDTIRQLRSLYVDLDVYTKGLRPEWVLGKLELEYFGQTIPDPNMVIFSGRGLVLIWNIEPIPYKALPLWKTVETFLVDELAELGADPKASDPARIFRIAGSINGKNGAVVRAEYRHEYRYDIHQIQYDYLPELEPKRLQERKPGRKPKVIRLFNTYTLHLARARDIAKIVELRNGDVGNCRENICFLYRYFTCCYTNDPEQALQDTISLNEEFCRPLPLKEVVNATICAEKAWKAKTDEKANEQARAMGYPGAGYNIKNKALIDWMQISEEEQQHLETIIGPKEKRRRDLAYKEAKRREEGIRPMDEYNQERRARSTSKLEVIRRTLKASPEASNRAVAREMGISEAYVRKLKAQL